MTIMFESEFNTFRDATVAFINALEQKRGVHAEATGFTSNEIGDEVYSFIVDVYVDDDVNPHQLVLEMPISVEPQSNPLLETAELDCSRWGNGRMQLSVRFDSFKEEVIKTFIVDMALDLDLVRDIMLEEVK